MLNKIKELNNMKKKKVTQKMINDAHRAWSILSELGYQCDLRGVNFRSTALHNFINSGMSGIVSDLEEQSND
tara:strand:- start:1973 stop:2188 length:216 start_codon:yes stop_codon:yes gene_type:complete